MGPDYAEIARIVVGLTRKEAPLQCSKVHTQAVRQLTALLCPHTYGCHNVFHVPQLVPHCPHAL